MNAMNFEMPRRHMSRTWNYALIIAVLIGAVCVIDNDVVAEDSNARRIDESTRWVMQLGEKYRTNIRSSEKDTNLQATRPRDFTEMGLQIHETEDPGLGNALIYYRAIQAWLASDDKAFSDEVQKAKKANVFQPDLLLYEVILIGEGGGKKLAKRIAAWDEYGCIVPISLYGENRADRLAPAGLIDPPLPNVPKLDHIEEQLVKIGDLYANSGLNEEAVDVYIESVFAMPHVSWEIKGSTWLKVGKIEAQLGQTQLAIQAYLKALFSDPALYGEVRKGIENVFKAKILESKEPSQPKLGTEAAMKIAELYRQCNLHPFALHVLSKIESSSSNMELTKKRTAIEKEWLLVVNKHQRIRGEKCMLLGIKVTNVKSWADVKITRPSDTFWIPRK